MRNRFLRIISALIVFIMAVPLSACKKKTETDDREIQSGVTVFSYYGTDPALSHEVGEAAENRVWRVGIEDYTANTVTLANEGVVAAAENVTLLRGTYVLTAELAVYGEAGKSGATNTYNPVAALQVVNDSGKVIANQHVTGSISLITDDFTSFSVTFDILQAGRYDVRVFSAGLNAIAVQRITVTNRLGDISGDGSVGADDLTFVKRALIGSVTVTQEQKYVADFNQDGWLDIRDLVKMKREIAESTPYGC